MLARLRTPTATWLLVIAGILSAWSLGIGWRTPELVAVQDGVAPLLEALRDGPLVGSIRLLRMLTLCLWIGVAVSLARTLRAATGWSLAPSLVPLASVLLLALPLSTRLLVDVRALPWVTSAWALLVSMELALTALDHPRRRLCWALSNVAVGAALVLLEAPLALLCAAIVSGLLAVPHRHRHALGLRRLPWIGIALGLAGCISGLQAFGGGLPPLSVSAAWAGPELAGPLRTVVFGALIVAFGLGLVVQRPYRQSLLTLLALAGACVLLEPLIPGSSYPGALLTIAALALTANAETTHTSRSNLRLTRLAWALLVLACSTASFQLARMHWAQNTEAQALLAGVVAELDAEARATRGLQLEVLLRTDRSAPSRTTLGSFALGSPTMAGPEVFLALGAPFASRQLSFAERLAAARIASAGEHGVQDVELFPTEADPDLAPRPRLVLQATITSKGTMTFERTVLPGYPIPLASVRPERSPDGSLTFDPPVPAYLIRELRVVLPPEAIAADVVATFGVPGEAPTLERTQSLMLPAGASGRSAPLALPPATVSLDSPPLTRVGLRPLTSGTEPSEVLSTPTHNGQLVDVELRTAPTYAYVVTPHPGAIWDLRAKAAGPELIGALSQPEAGAPLLRAVRFEARLFVAAEPVPLPARLFPPDQPAPALAPNRPPGWDLLLSGSLTSPDNRLYTAAGPLLLGPADPTLAARRTPWKAHLTEGLAQALAKSGPELDARLQLTLLGPSDLVLARSLEIPLSVRTDAATSSSASPSE